MGSPEPAISSASTCTSTNDRAHATTESKRTVPAASENGTSDAMTLDRDNDTSEQAEEQDAPEQRPPLPPRPSLLQASDPSRPPLTTSKQRPALQAKPTTAISSVDIETLSFPDGSRGTFSTPASRGVSESVSISGTSGGQSTPRKVSRNGSEFDDSTSLMSYTPTLRGANGDLASLLDEGLNSQSPAWKLLTSQADSVNPFEKIEYDDLCLINFEHEFDEIEAVDSKGGNEGASLYELLCSSR
jgi:hypothetical protein